jgi:hypothetical protein
VQCLSERVFKTNDVVANKQAEDPNSHTILVQMHLVRCFEEQVANTEKRDEFIRRFLLHLIPSGFKRIRHFGFLAPGGISLHFARRMIILYYLAAGT